MWCIYIYKYAGKNTHVHKNHVKIYFVKRQFKVLSIAIFQYWSMSGWYLLIYLSAQRTEPPASLVLSVPCLWATQAQGEVSVPKEAGADGAVVGAELTGSQAFQTYVGHTEQLNVIGEYNCLYYHLPALLLNTLWVPNTAPLGLLSLEGLGLFPNSEEEGLLFHFSAKCCFSFLALSVQHCLGRRLLRKVVPNGISHSVASHTQCGISHTVWPTVLLKAEARDIKWCSQSISLALWKHPDQRN